MKKKVICAISGGVDSSVAAALLKKQGCDVIGVFMKLWAEDVPRTDLVRENICCSLEAATAARAVCNKLKIPFYVVNFEKVFKKSVVDYFIKEYELGRTPNPCVICNRDIKSEILLKKTVELEGDYLATGHYARVRQKKENRKKKIEYELLQGKDRIKDQSYFLWTLKQKQLKHLLFPIGDYKKTEVRKMAEKWGLPTAKRKESQGTCFIPDRDVCAFLRRHAKKLTLPGPILDLEGKHLGIHNGLVNYTIGQRERLGMGGPKAYYVVKLKSSTNTLIVGSEKDLYKKKLIADNINWISKTPPKNISGLKVGARIRYGHPIEESKITINKNKLEVTFKKSQRAVTPGQSIVFFDKEKVLGGGVINKSL